MELFIVDGEGGMTSTYFVEEMKRRGVTVDIRAPRRHARFIERRGAILRHAMHTAEDQMERKGVVVHFDFLAAHSIFAGNSLTRVGGVTPYSVVFGRQPSMLPPMEIEELGVTTGGDAPGVPDGATGSDAPCAPEGGEAQTNRLQWRIRETALQRMIEATSIARFNRALRTRATPSAEGRDRTRPPVYLKR